MQLIFVLAYASAVYFLLGLLYPDEIGPGFDMRSHFEANRGWFFSVLLAFAVLDLVDTLGVIMIAEMDVTIPPLYWVLLTAWLVGSAAALRVRNRRFHEVFALALVVLFALQTLFDLDTFELRTLYGGG